MDKYNTRSYRRSILYIKFKVIKKVVKHVLQNDEWMISVTNPDRTFEKLKAIMSIEHVSMLAEGV